MELWDDLVAAAILGTERQPSPGPGGPEPLAPLLASLADRSPEAALLAAAAATSAYCRAGTVPPGAAGAPPEPARRETSPECSRASAAHLALLLEGKHPGVLAEWLDALGQAGKRLPREHLPAVLARVRSQEDLLPHAEPVLGERGRWLARLNPDWDAASAPVPAEAWETGTLGERCALLHRLRAENPTAARELIASTWDQEDPAARVTLLESLRVALGPGDEPLLERALDDRRKEVRTRAAALLATLPTSALCRRMEARAERSVVVARKLLSRALEVTPPSDCDAAMVRDGIDPKPPQGAALGERAWWLRQIISGTPIGYWNRRWGLAPRQWIDLAGQTEWKSVLLSGWSTAVERMPEDDWIAALLDTELPLSETAGLWKRYPAPRRDEFLRAALRSPETLRDNERLAPYLLDHEGRWTRDLAVAVIEALRHCIASPVDRGYRDYQLRPVLQAAARRVPPELLPLWESGWPIGSEAWRLWSAPVEEFLSTVQFRHDMLEEIAR